MLRAAVRSPADVETHPGFESARARLGVVPFDFLVTNIRLGPYNGLHLVYLVRDGQNAARPQAIVYSEAGDIGLAREAQQAGAFYETRGCVAVTLTAYLEARLPPFDRRDPATPDRRARFRGGRRCWESHLAGRAL